MNSASVLRSATRTGAGPGDLPEDSSWDREALAAALAPQRRASRRLPAVLAVLVVGAAGFLGGIVVKLGSQRIDASIRTKLNRLAQAMKG